MIKGDYDYLTNLAKYNVCAEHKTPLVVAWHSTEKAWVLRCGAGSQVLDELPDGAPYKSELPIIRGHYPDAITRNPSLTELYKQGEELPSFIEDNIKKSQRRKTIQEGKKTEGQGFRFLPNVDLATGQEVSLAVMNALIDYAVKYELDPMRGHVVLMYSKPYITIDGYLYHAARSKRPYRLGSRPLSDDERREMQVNEGDHAWHAEIELINPEGFFVGIGIVTKEEMEAKSPRDATKLRSPVVAAHPWQLAQKRAEWQALRRAFPIGETKEEKDGDATHSEG